MTLQDQMIRALKGAKTAREGLRLGGNDLMLDHWASRLMFWKDEATRLRLLSGQAYQPGATLAEQHDLTEEGEA